MPRRISSPHMRKTFSASADATAPKGTRRPSIMRAFAERHFRRGTIAFRPSATGQEAETAMKSFFIRTEVGRAVDLLALALLMATLERLVYDLPGESPECLAMLAIVGIPE